MNKANKNQLKEVQQTVASGKKLSDPIDDQIHVSYWQHQLGGSLPVFELLPKSHRTTSSGKERKKIISELPGDLSDWVRKFSENKSIPSSVIFLTAYEILLHKYSNLEDIIVGVTIDNGVEHDANVVPVRTQFEEGIRFDDFIQNVQNTITDATNHSAYSFPRILNELNLKESEKEKIFQVIFTYQNSRQKAGFLSIQQLSEIETTEGVFREGQGHLELEIVEHRKSFILYFKYNPDVYTSESIHRFMDGYNVLLSEISKDAERQIHAYPIITESERNKVVVDFNNTKLDFPQERCVHQFFEEKARLNPDSPAVAFGNEKINYQQLYSKVYDLALFLQSLGIKPDSFVGLCLERSVEMMVGIQGVLLAGGAYVPLDPDYPDDRLAYMIEDCQAPIVLCQHKLKDKLKSLVSKETILISLDESWDEIVVKAEELKKQETELEIKVQPHHIAYVIYTSGSTGRPKGVMVEHKALMNRINWMQRMYQLTEEDVVLQKTPFSFDVSVWEFVWPMMAGASVVFAKPGGHKEVTYLEGLIREKKITTMHFVPSMLHTYLEHAQGRCYSVRQIFCSGEALDGKSATEYKQKFPESELHNLYGPTEAAIDVTFFDCSQLKTYVVPIGAPISNIQIYILDTHHNPLPIGVAGELYIAGVGLARGYHNRLELTSEKFIPNPFTQGERMYKSGDLARWMEDGNIEYLGRIDTQVKIRGFRIETGEIEAQLNLHPEINSSCVVVQGQDADKKLVAFYHAKNTSEGNVSKVKVEDLRSHLLTTLPEYMIPSVFVSLESFPITPNGKMNRGSLIAMNVQSESSQHYEAPRNVIEQQLVEIWAEVLNLESGKIGINDNFFELGGHSLLVTQLISKIRSQLSVNLPQNAFFDLYTIANIAEVINAITYKDEIGDVEFEEITI